MNNDHARTYDPPPSFWVGDSASFTTAIKKAAIDIKSQLGNPDNPAFKELGVWLADVILNNQRGVVVEDISDWDKSTRGQLSNESFDLSLYETVGEFLDEEFTGNTVATFDSGSGFAAETYSTLFTQDSWQAFNLLVRYVNPSLCDPSDGGIHDEVLDALSTEGAADYEVEERFRSLPIRETFFRYMGAALEERERDRIEQARMDAEAAARTNALKQLAGLDLPNQINSFVGSKKWDMSNIKYLNRFLDSLVVQYGDARIGAALRFAIIYTSHKANMLLQSRYKIPK